VSHAEEPDDPNVKDRKDGAKHRRLQGKITAQYRKIVQAVKNHWNNEGKRCQQATLHARG